MLLVNLIKSPCPLNRQVLGPIVIDVEAQLFLNFDRMFLGGAFDDGGAYCGWVFG